MNSDQKLWFRAKKYGWGWVPVTWQGWACIAVYVVALLLEIMSIDFDHHKGIDSLFIFLPSVIIFTIVLLVVCFATGEKPEWRWGNKKK